MNDEYEQYMSQYDEEIRQLLTYRNNIETWAQYDKRKIKGLNHFFPKHLIGTAIVSPITIKKGMIKIKTNVRIDVSMVDKTGLLKFNFEMGEVSGNYDCSSVGLYSLHGGPSYVQKDYNCSNNPIETLFGGPDEVMVSYKCNFTNITNLVGSPKRIGNDLDCRECNLRSFEGLNEVGVNGDGYVLVTYNSYIPVLRNISLTSRIKFYNMKKSVADILSKYNKDIPSKKILLLCQKELIDNGFAGNAGW